jgi:hypothetical protein
MPPIAATLYVRKRFNDYNAFSLPKTTIVLPVRVNTPQALTFLLLNVFCIADTKPPAAPVTMLPLIAAFTESFGWY